MRGKILPILLLFGFIITSVTHHVLFQVQRMNAFHLFSAAKDSEHSGSIQNFLYTGQTGFQWEKLNKEFSFNGKLYDVVSSRDTKSGLEIKCIADHHEDDIVLTYLNLIDTTRNNKEWISFLKLKPIYSIPEGMSERNHEILYSNLVIVLNPSFPSSPDLEIFSPPPKQYCTQVVG